MNIAPNETQLFRILTEDINRRGIEAIVNKSFSGYTIIEAQGYWNGVKENSLIIEINNTFLDRVREVAKAIKVLNNQESVLIQEFNVGTAFI